MTADVNHIKLKRLSLGAVVFLTVAALAFAVTSAFAANLSCPPDCTGTAGSDTINGNGNNNNIDARGGDDSVYGNGGHDAEDGEGGSDGLVDDHGNDTIRGGDGASDVSWGIADSGTDDLYGGANNGDQCYYDVSIGNDNVDSTCEQKIPY
ncbi:MAG: hypothetical protein U0R24_00665 [Solirubrobacterales bacterium]